MIKLHHKTGVHLLLFNKFYIYLRNAWILELSTFNLGARWGWVVSSTPRPLCPPGKTRYPLYRRLGGPQGRSGRVQYLLLSNLYLPRDKSPCDTFTLSPPVTSHSSIHSKEATRRDSLAQNFHNRLGDLVTTAPSLARRRRGGLACVVTVMLCGSDVCVVDVGGGFRSLLALRSSFLWPVNIHSIARK